MIQPQKLSSQQRKMVEDNHELIYRFLKHYGLSEDEYYDVAALGLCRAGLYYQENKGMKFSTFAFQLMKQTWSKVLDKSQSDSFYISFQLSENDSLIYSQQTICEYSDVINCMALFQFLTNINNRNHKKALFLLAEGKTRSVVADECGLTPNAISFMRRYYKQQYLQLQS